MNYTDIWKKKIHLKMSILMKTLKTVAAVMLLSTANAAGAATIAVNGAINTVAEQRTLLRLDVASLYAETALNIKIYPMEQPFRCAAAAQENILVKKLEIRLPDLYWNPGLNLRIPMSDDYLSELDRIVIEGDKLKVWTDKMGRCIRELYALGIVDDYTAGFMTKRVNKAKRKLAFRGVPFLSPELYHGHFFFGNSLFGKKLQIPAQWLNGHLLQVCGTGAGKTNASKVRAFSIARFVNGCWLIDLRKTEYRALLPIFNNIGIDLKIIRGRQFKINPLSVPANVQPLDYASVISECLVRVLNLPPRSATLLKTTIIQLYAQTGVLNGNIEAPTLFDLHRSIKNNREANSQARQAITDNLFSLLVSLGPDVLGYHKGWDIHQLAKQHLVIELSGLCEAGKDLILSYLLTAEFISRISRGISNPSLDLWVAFDEAQRMFSAKKESAGYGGNPLIDLLGLVRGCGVGLEISVLTTVDMSPSLVNLTASKVIGRMGSATEYSTAGGFVGLTPEQIQWAVHHMEPGLFIGQVGEGSFRYPFVFRMPLLKDLTCTKPVSDREADRTGRKTIESKVIRSRTLWP